MSMNLIVRNANYAGDKASTQWAAIQAASQNEHGLVMIDDNTVSSIARLVDGVTLTNGETVVAYAYEDDDDYATFVPAFGPSLLPIQVQDQIRDRLASGENGKVAVALYNEMLRMSLQIGLHGTENCPAYIKGVNWAADEVEVNRSNGNMVAMIRELGLDDACEAETGFGEVSFDRFVAAVNDNGLYTDMESRLQTLIACGRRQGATHVYWA